MSEVPLYTCAYIYYHAGALLAAGMHSSAGERGGNSLNDFRDMRTENGSNQGRNLALTLLFVPNSLDSGWWVTGTVLNLRTTTSQKCAAVPRRARI